MKLIGWKGKVQKILITNENSSHSYLGDDIVAIPEELANTALLIKELPVVVLRNKFYARDINHINGDLNNLGG
jgi:hypothetical protein